MYCFISTMWDVKAFMLGVGEYKKDEFYLDYVGCKESIKKL